MSGSTFPPTLHDFEKQGGESSATLYQIVHKLLDHANNRANTKYQAAEAVKEDLNEAKHLLAKTTLRVQQAQQTPKPPNSKTSLSNFSKPHKNLQKITTRSTNWKRKP
jgi:hypothetical protein